MMVYHGPAGTLLQGMNGQSVVQEDGSSKLVMDSLQSPIAFQGLLLILFYEPMSDFPCGRCWLIKYAWSGSNAEWYVSLVTLTDT